MAAYHAPKRVALACKRMRSGFSVLKFCMRTFSGYLFRNRQARRRKLHIACGDFFTKVTGAPLRCVSFSAKGHARLPCSVASALATVRCRYQPFAGSDPPRKAEMHSLLLPLYTSERVTLVPIFVEIKIGHTLHSSSLPQKSPAALRDKKHSRVPRLGFLPFACLPLFRGLRLRRRGTKKDPYGSFLCGS